MNGAVLEGTGWPARRLVWTVLLLLTVQYALLVYLSEHPPRRDRAGSRAAPTFLVPNLTFEQELEAGLSSDPTLFALVHPRGFSGSAWMDRPDFPYGITNELDRPRWLTASGGSLLSEFTRFMLTSVRGTALVLEKPAPAVGVDSAATGVLRIVPQLSLQGELAEWRLASAEALPGAAAEQVLMRCIVEVSVGANGQVISCRLLTSSGLAQADEAALGFARRARFAPPEGTSEPSAALAAEAVVGTLVFQWAAEETTPEAAPGRLP